MHRSAHTQKINLTPSGGPDRCGDEIPRNLHLIFRYVPILNILARHGAWNILDLARRFDLTYLVRRVAQPEIYGETTEVG